MEVKILEEKAKAEYLALAARVEHYRNDSCGDNEEFAVDLMLDLLAALRGCVEGNQHDA